MASVLKTSSQPHPVHAAGERVATSAANLAGFNLSDLAEQGRQQIASCREIASKIVGDAQQQADAIAKQAKKEGYAEGQKKAAEDSDKKIKAAAEQRAKEQLALIHAAVEQLYRTYEQWMQQYADSLITIAIASSERIVQNQLSADKAVLVRWVKDAIESTRASSKLTVAIHPEMLAELGQAIDEMIAGPEFSIDTHLVPDETLELTSVVVRQDGGEIEAGLRAQLDRLSEMLR